jgi:monoamine oxidase
VRRIRWGGAGVEVETAAGTLRAGAVVITASTTAIRDALRFDPVLPPDVQVALEGVPVGAAEKVALAYSRDIFGMPENSHLAYIHDTRAATRFHIKPGGQPVAIAYLAGQFAAELEAAGSDAMIDFAEGELVKALGSSIRTARAAAVATHWRSNPYIRGGYSSARPGAANLRPILFEPVGERIYFAGEACSVSGFGTVHAAHASGVKAAERIAALVQKRKSA